jgi:hypothetical protein
MYIRHASEHNSLGIGCQVVSIHKIDFMLGLKGLKVRRTSSFPEKSPENP